MLVLDSSR